MTRPTKRNRRSLNSTKVKYAIIALFLLTFVLYTNKHWNYDNSGSSIKIYQSNNSSKKLERYYVDHREELKYQGPFDRKGIPLVDYGKEIGHQYNPVTVSKYAIAAYERYLKTNIETDKLIFLKQANWLVDNLKITSKGFGVWY